MKTKEEIRLEEPISVMCLHGRYLRIDETYCQELLQKSTSQVNCAPLHKVHPFTTTEQGQDINLSGARTSHGYF